MKKSSILMIAAAFAVTCSVTSSFAEPVKHRESVFKEEVSTIVKENVLNAEHVLTVCPVVYVDLNEAFLIESTDVPSVFSPLKNELNAWSKPKLNDEYDEGIVRCWTGIKLYSLFDSDRFIKKDIWLSNCSIKQC